MSACVGEGSMLMDIDELDRWRTLIWMLGRDFEGQSTEAGGWRREVRGCRRMVGCGRKKRG